MLMLFLFYFFVLDELGKSKTQCAFMLRGFNFKLFFNISGSEPFVVFESDLIIVSFRDW